MTMMIVKKIVPLDLIPDLSGIPPFHGALTSIFFQRFNFHEIFLRSFLNFLSGRSSVRCMPCKVFTHATIELLKIGLSKMKKMSKKRSDQINIV